MFSVRECIMQKKLVSNLSFIVIAATVFLPYAQAEESSKSGLIGIQYGKEGFDTPQSIVVLTSLGNTWDKENNYGNQWSGKWQGFITGPADGQVDFTIETTKPLKLEIDGKVIAKSKSKIKSGSVRMVNGRKYPVVVSFNNGSKNCSFKISWSWQGQQAIAIGESNLSYNAGLDAKMAEMLVKSQQEEAKGEAEQPRLKRKWPKKQVSKAPKAGPASAKVSEVATNPNPGVTLKNVSKDVTLSWTASPMAISHDVYFGRDADEIKTATTSSKVHKGRLDKGKESFSPGELKEGTYYYWRVDEVSDSGTNKGYVWKFRTKGKNLVLQVDISVPTCDHKGVWEGTAKPGWTILAAKRWADMYMHDGVWFPSKKDPAAFAAGIEGTGVKAFLSTGSEGQLGIAVKGVCRANLGGGGCPSGKAQGDPICNSWGYAVDWAGPYAGDIILLLKDLPAGVYELYSYHNHWEPCKQSTRNCLDCFCGMPPMPSITANALPAKPDESTQDKSDNILSQYRWNLPPGTGKGVTAIKNAYNVAPQHVYYDEELVPSVLEFATDGSEVLIIYQADRSVPLYPDCARKGREGARGILNAFELIQVSGL